MIINQKPKNPQQSKDETRLEIELRDDPEFDFDSSLNDLVKENHL